MRVELSKMCAWKAKRVLGIGIVGASTWGCQIVGELPGELELNDDHGSLPPRDALVWTAEEPGPDVVYTLPEWLKYLNRTDGARTTEIAPGVLRGGYTKHQARPRNVGTGWGLVLETERTNLLPYSDWIGPVWQMPAENAMLLLPNAAGPAEDTSAVGLMSAGNQQSPFAVVEGSIASAWIEGVQGQAPFAYFAYGNTYVPVSEKGWKRYDVVKSPMDEGLFRLQTRVIGDAPAITSETAMTVYGAQVEVGRYPSSLIATTGVPALREADVLHVEMETLAPSGYFDVTIRFAPHYATGEQTVDQDLIALEDDNVFFRMKAGGTLTLLKVGSQDSLRIEGLDWARNQPLTVRVQYLPNWRMISVEGATAGNGSTSKLGAVAPVGEDSTAWLLGDNDGPQESVDLQYLEIR